MISASDITIEADEDGWHLLVVGEEGERYDFNIHAISNRLLAEAKTKLGPYWAEAYAPRRENA